MLFRRLSSLLAVVLVILISIPSALAQEVEIFGYKLSFIVVAPIVLIVIFLIVFTIIVLKDVLKEKYGSIKGLIGLKIKGIKSKLPVKKPGVGEIKLTEPKKEKPTMSYLSELNKLKRELNSLPAQEAYERLTDIIRTFFSELLQIDYEFTFDELEKELSRKHKNIVFFSKNLSELCYDSEETSKPQLLGVINELEGIVKNIFEPGETITEEPYNFKEKFDSFLYRKGLLKPEEYLQKIDEIKKKRKLEKEFKVKGREDKERGKGLLRRKRILEEEKRVQKRIEELKKKEDALKKKSSPSSAKKDKLRIMKLITKGNQITKKNIEKAGDIYEEVFALYSNLPEDDKKDLYPKVIRLYNRIDKAKSK